MIKVDDRKILFSNFKIQDFNTDTCWLYFILILFLLNNTRKIKFEDIIIGLVKMDSKRAFISQRLYELDTSNFVTIPKGDYRYINEPISEDVNMNNRKINNFSESTEENDVRTIKSLTVYYNKKLSLNMSNHKITNLLDWTDPNDAVNFKQISSFDNKYLKQQINLVGSVAIGYANMMAMPVLNVALSIDFSCAVYLS